MFSAGPEIFLLLFCFYVFSFVRLICLFVGFGLIISFFDSVVFVFRTAVIICKCVQWRITSMVGNGYNKKNNRLPEAEVGSLP